MPADPPTDAPDPLDRFFDRSAPIREDLTDRVLAAVRAEEEAGPGTGDTWWEDALAAWPVEPTADFADRTIARVHAEEGPKVVPWRLVVSLTSALAACLALVVGPASGPSGGPVERAPYAQTPSPAAPVSTENAPAYSVDADITRILVLAESLETPARWLLDDAHQTTIAVALE